MSEMTVLVSLSIQNNIIPTQGYVNLKRKSNGYSRVACQIDIRVCHSEVLDDE